MNNTNTLDRKTTDRRERRASAEAFIKKCIRVNRFPILKKIYIEGKLHPIKVGNA